MSSKDNGSSEFVLVFVFFGCAVLAVATFFAAVLGFLALVCTVLCLIAWNEPLTLGSLSIQPHQARAFILRGLIGMVAAPVFVIFCELLFQQAIPGGAWTYIIFGGYVLGSIGVEFLRDEEDAKAPPTLVLPARNANPPLTIDQTPAAAPSSSAAPFRYASWDDEEARS